MKNKKILITGGYGFLGKTLINLMIGRGFQKENLIIPSSKDFDLTKEASVKKLYKTFKPNIVIHLAAQVGGIDAISQNPGIYFYNNSLMGLYLTEYGRQANLDQFIYVGSGCSYPKYCDIPFIESDLWQGFPEENVASYAIAKKSLIVLLQSYKKQYNFNSCVLIPSNLYGPKDHFYKKGAHVVPSIITKVHNALKNKEKTIKCWGSGLATRDFLYSEDAAEAIILSINKIYNPDPINIGSGQETSIKSLLEKIMFLFEYSGDILWDQTNPEGQPRRLMSIEKAASLLEWKPSTSIDEGLEKTVKWFINNYN